MNGLADVDGFKMCIQVSVTLGFPPLATLIPATFSKKQLNITIDCLNSLICITTNYTLAREMVSHCQFAFFNFWIPKGNLTDHRLSF